MWSEMYFGIYVKHPSFLSGYNETWIFLQIFEKHSISNLMKFRPVGAELFYVDGRTYGERDMTKIMVSFRNFAKAPNNNYVYT